MSAATLVGDLSAFAIQIALIVLAVAILVKAIHIPARVRYHGLRLALLAALVVPWLLRAADIPHDRARGLVQPALTLRTPAEALPGELPPIESFVAPETGLSILWVTVLLGALGLGAAGRGTWLAVGLMRLRRMTKAGRVLEEPEYAELQAQIGARATIAQVCGLAQPATFGVRRPVVMLPEALAAAPASLRRAVIIHELYHVRRRDWVFVLAEELVRTVLWFHPAILWLTSHIQLAREEIVDDLTVRATGDRRGYVQALLSFADSGGLSPAPAFARRRQLFHRILGVSKEKVMSRPRIVISSVMLVAVVFAASWSASALFPIVKASPVTVLFSPTSLIGVQDASLAAPVSLLAEDGFRTSASTRSRVAQLEQQTAAVVTPRQVTPENPIPRRTRGVAPAWPTQAPGQQIAVVVNMRVTLDRSGSVTAVDRNGCSVTQTRDQEAGCNAFYDATAAAIRQWRYERPVQAPLQFNVAVSFKPGAQPAIAQSGSDWDEYVRETQEVLRASSDQVRGEVTRAYLKREIFELANTARELERALRIESERYQQGHPAVDQIARQVEMLNTVMAGLRDRMNNANGAANEMALARRQVAQAEAQLEEIERQFAISRRQPEASIAGDVSPTPTTPFDGSPQLRSPSGRAPIRVGGPITAPRVLKSVHPQYTAEAMQARIQGTVQMEALIDEQGRVADARILKSLPLLDEQALAAAKQWEFTPSLLNGQPVPVLVMIELEFNLRK